ncbi:MAG: hypothetical protein WD076_00045, partial [Parvularculaceae bacterium]
MRDLSGIEILILKWIDGEGGVIDVDDEVLNGATARLEELGLITINECEIKPTTGQSERLGTIV